MGAIAVESIIFSPRIYKACSILSRKQRGIFFAIITVFLKMARSAKNGAKGRFPRVDISITLTDLIEESTINSSNSHRGIKSIFLKP